MLYRVEISTDRSYEGANEKKLKREVLASIVRSAEDLDINVNRIQFIQPPNRRSKTT